MTPGTGERRFLEILRLMAGLAFHVSMQPLQLKHSLVVVKHHLLFPTGFVVTTFALRSERALVHISRFMTSNARRADVILIDIAFVTSRAAQRRMRFAQRPFRVARVIEADFGP